MTRLFVLLVALVLYLAPPVAQAFAASHVRPPDTALVQPTSADTESTRGTNTESTDTEWTRGEITAGVQAVGSVGAVLLAILVGWWQFHQSHRLTKEQRESEDRDRKLKARSLALALYPELLEMKAKIQRAKGLYGVIRVETLGIPPVLIQSVHRLYLLDEAGRAIQNFLAASRQFERMVEDPPKPDAAAAGEVVDVNQVLAGHVDYMRDTLDDAIELIDPIVDAAEH